MYNRKQFVRMPLRDTYKVQLKRVKDGIDKERVKIPRAPPKEGYKPFIWNSLEGYYDTSVPEYVINCPKEDMQPQVPYSWVDKDFDDSLIDVSTRKTTLRLVDPLEDFNMAKEILPKLRDSRPSTKNSNFRSSQRGSRPPTNDSADRQRIWENINLKLPKVSPERGRDTARTAQNGEEENQGQVRRPQSYSQLTEENIKEANTQQENKKDPETKVKLPRNLSANSKRRERSPYRTAYNEAALRTSVSQHQSRHAHRQKSSKTYSSRTSYSPERGRILLPEIHKVEFDVVNDNATKEFPYSGVPTFREKMHRQYDIDAPKRVDEDYKKTKKDFYLMKLHKLSEVHPSNRSGMRKAYFAYLQNNPGSKKAVKDCVNQLVSDEPHLKSTTPRTSSTSPVRTGAN
ncbi:uncharacterized protein LOC117316654 isoform X1 [Pecten maximus]|uniref:uncharacterized protein LOC117316654 isoform X1 n=2 Tax=Pecten maximus TaxID=6579 RepID=UPI001458C11A|nr:uncharacterized protein LOC117316654 isoform X1 [Pecten maximus]